MSAADLARHRQRVSCADEIRADSKTLPQHIRLVRLKPDLRQLAVLPEPIYSERFRLLCIECRLFALRTAIRSRMSGYTSANRPMAASVAYLGQSTLAASEVLHGG